MLKKILKKFASKNIIDFYHLLLAYTSNIYYRQPSNKLIVIGVTGTNGKTTVVNLISWILQSSGKKTASTSTAQFFINGKKWLNNLKMTMPGRFYLQKFLATAVKENCQYAIIETSSEGIKQNRHKTINYDGAVFTNLTPEHIESHGSFENYRAAKLELWQHLLKCQVKKINGKNIDKFSIINSDSIQAPYFLQIPKLNHTRYGIDLHADYTVDKIEFNDFGVQFVVQETATEQTVAVSSNLPGKVNIYNLLAAISCCRKLNISLEDCAQAIKNYPGTPGRFEFIPSNKPFDIMVDYAHEPEALTRLYETLLPFAYNNIIHVLGSCGGGRDKNRRPVLGKIAGENANKIIVTNEDPYDENPEQIIREVVAGVKQTNFKAENVLVISDRALAIKKAIELAGPNDLVLITGKGAEQWMCLANNEKIPWDDREIVKKFL